MARLSSKELLEPFAEAAERKSPQHNFDNVPAGLVAAAMAEFDGCDPAGRPALKSSLSKIAGKFVHRSVEPYLGEPGHQKQLLQHLAGDGDIYESLAAIAPEYLVEITGYLDEAATAWLLEPIGEPPEIIARVRRAAGMLAEHYEPPKGRRNDLALEEAVRSLVEVTLPVSGEFPRVSSNKNNDIGGPTPSCAAARAIEILLRGIDPALTTTAVMNMISKVRREPEPSEDPMMALLLANPIKVLDCSLLPDREEAIAELRAEMLPQ